MNIYNLLIIICLNVGYIFSSIPNQYTLSNIKLDRHNFSINGSIASNAVIDIKTANDSIYFFGTAKGLSSAKITNTDSIIFDYFDKIEMPLGGNPAVTINNNIIAVSGVKDTSVLTGLEPKGTGLAFSVDYGLNWQYIPQPIDDIPISGQYHTIKWGNQNLQSLAVTTDINNVTYDLAIHNNYIYAASWAGGLRRYYIGELENKSNDWEIIPLPRDDDFSLKCGQIDSTYYLNPRDPIDNGYHNHKGFSVFIDNNTIWVGTAAGINKGIINGDCIDWDNHYTSWINNLSGNWVIGFEIQELNNFTKRLWAITWSADTPGEYNALSYTDDDGENWSTTQPSGKSEKVYNIFTNLNKIWASTESGLYISEDGIYWEKYLQPIDYNTNEKLLNVDGEILTSYFSNNLNWLWVGSSDGIAITNDDGFSWSLHRFYNSVNPNESDYINQLFSVYPNPFYTSNNYTRFIYYNPDTKNSNIDIFDFSMDKVISLNNINHINNSQSEIIWNGRNEYGDIVSNGIYFCRVLINNKYYWTKVAIIN